jgi:hypothetical protein
MVRAIGMARAEAFEAQVAALGQSQTALVNVANALAEGRNRFIPEVLVAGGGNASFDGLAAVLTKYLLAAPAQSTGAALKRPEAPAAAEAGEPMPGLQEPELTDKRGGTD